MTGRTDGGEITTVTITPDGSPAANHAAKHRASSALLMCVVLLYTAFGAR